MNDENPYTPPVSAPEAASSQPATKAAGGLTRLLAFLVMAFFIPTIIATIWNAQSLRDCVNVGLLSLFALEFAHIGFTGKLYPNSLNT